MATIVTRAGKGSPLTHNEVDANFNNLNNDKAELASPPFTGTPTAPTATVGTDTTQIATTAFVNAEIANDAPSKTGTGASGTWAISISGDAASVDGKSFGTFTAAGGVAYATDTSTLAATDAGTSGQVLQSNGASAPSWVTPSAAAPTTAQVGTATAGLSAGAVGSYAYARPNDSTAYAFGATIAGSLLLPVNSLIYDATSGNATTCTAGAAQAGTWQCMGNRANNRGNTNSATLWLRIS
jgi:hypothetical protein